MKVASAPLRCAPLARPERVRGAVVQESPGFANPGQAHRPEKPFNFSGPASTAPHVRQDVSRSLQHLDLLRIFVLKSIPI